MRKQPCLGTLVVVGCSLSIVSVESARGESFDLVNVTRRTASSVTYRIDRPNVKQRRTDYPTVVFRKGQVVTLRAGGCVQTGGAGRTWKRYVNPSGRNADTLYSGMAWIRGANPRDMPPQLTRIAGLVNRSIEILTDTALTLGYQDDNFSDNGYWGHDDGTENQCKGVGPAWVEVDAVNRPSNAPPVTRPEPKPLDLIADAVDANGLPLNPRWAAQKPGARLNIGAACPLAVASTPRPQACTSQAPDWDRSASCDVKVAFAGGEGGHLNWFPATFTGTVSWTKHDDQWPLGDDDYNFKLFPPGLALATKADQFVEIEFDSDETIDQFRSAWWESFHRAVDKDNDKRFGAAEMMIGASEAIVIGLVGLDCAHSCDAEVHPVHLLAMRVTPDRSQDRWVIFARNWGNEGYCGSHQHFLDRRELTLMLPAPRAFMATGVREVRREFKTNSRAAGVTNVVFDRGHARITFLLPEPEAKGQVNGEIVLAWSGASVSMAPASRLAVSVPAVSSVSRMQKPARTWPIFRGLNASHIKSLKMQRMKRAPQTQFDAQHLRTAPAASVARPSDPKRVYRRAVDSYLESQHRARLKALCDVWGGRPPRNTGLVCR